MHHTKADDPEAGYYFLNEFGAHIDQVLKKLDRPGGDKLAGKAHTMTMVGGTMTGSMLVFRHSEVRVHLVLWAAWCVKLAC